MDRRSPDCGKPYDIYAPHLEVIGPRVASRVKQWDNSLSPRIDTGQIWTFAEIAAVASQGKIAGFVSSAVLPDHDVLDVMG